MPLMTSCRTAIFTALLNPLLRICQTSPESHGTGGIGDQRMRSIDAIPVSNESVLQFHESSASYIFRHTDFVFNAPFMSKDAILNMECRHDQESGENVWHSVG